jgi:hypothetical protein
MSGRDAAHYNAIRCGRLKLIPDTGLEVIAHSLTRGDAAFEIEEEWKSQNHE